MLGNCQNREATANMRREKIAAQVGYAAAFMGVRAEERESDRSSHEVNKAAGFF